MISKYINKPESHNFISNKYSFWVEGLLGLALGTACMTSLRIEFIGISEILFAIFVFVNSPLLLSRYRLASWRHGFSLIYILFTFFLVLPVVSFSTFYSTELKSDLVYILSFWLAILIFFILHKLILTERINLSSLTLIGIITFLFINFFAYFSTTSDYYGRFVGFSNNPNQVMFFASSFILLASLFLSGFWKYISIISCIFIGALSLSDAFFFFLAFGATSYVFFRIFLIKSLTFNMRILASFISLFVMLVVLYFFNFFDFLFILWNASDEGNSRIALMINGAKVAFNYPLFGLGVGSFSGYSEIFEGRESHNTLIDIAMQFGIIFAFFVYFIFIRSIFFLLAKKQILSSSILLAFIVTSQFHFFGRHIIFWVLFGVLFSFMFMNKDQEE